MIKITHKGDFSKTIKFLTKIKVLSIYKILEKYGRMGVEALAAATPVDTGKTADSWTYEIEPTSSGYSINWLNTNVNKHVNIALILQYGHGTRNGGYVKGRDYINPAIQPIFDKMSSAIWQEVENA